MQAEEPALAVRDLTITFGGLHAVQDLSFDVPSGAIVSVIGPNGAGKTTLLNAISGFVRARGSIRFKHTELLRLAAHRRADLGIARTFQSVQLFPGMTVSENVITAMHSRLGGSVLHDMLRFPVLGAERRAQGRAQEILQLLNIEAYAHRPADTLPFGVQKLTGVARALAIEPQLLLLDEPAAGLNRQEVEAFSARVFGLRSALGLTILLVEHNMRLVMHASDHVVVLNQGRKLTEGIPTKVSRDPQVISAYLGSPDESDDEKEAVYDSPQS